MTALDKIFTFTHKPTTPYSHEENGMVERANKEILRHLRAIVAEKGIEDEWSDALPTIKRIMNVTENEDIGFSPAELLYGPAHNLDFFAMDAEQPEAPPNLPQLEWLAIQQDIQNKAIEITRRRLDEALSKRRAAQIELDEQIVFEEDDYVLVDYPAPSLPVGNPEVKIRAYKRGPMKVVGHVDNTYTVKDTFTNQEYDVHISRLHKFLYDKDRVDPNIIALRDHNAFVVDRILAFYDSAESRKDWEVLVRWKGFDSSYDSPIPWAEMQHNPLMHEYLRTHRKARLIPKPRRITTAGDGA